MLTIGEFIKQDMESRGIKSYREYADFIGSKHPTVSKYANNRFKRMQWDFLVKLSNATQTDIGTLARYVAPEVTFEILPTTQLIAERIGQLPIGDQEHILKSIDALLAQQQRGKHGK